MAAFSDLSIAIVGARTQRPSVEAQGPPTSDA